MSKKCGFCSRILGDNSVSCQCGTDNPFGSTGNTGKMLATAVNPRIFTPGVDISTYQESSAIPGDIKYNLLAEKAKFCYVKRSQATFRDADGDKNYASLRGLCYRGSYHYIDWTKAAFEQADFFCSTFADDPGELPPWADYECRKNAPSREIALRFLSDFLGRVEYRMGLMRWCSDRPLIYTSPGYWADYGSSSPQWNRFGLAIAHYYVTAPLIPLPWTHYDFWQHSDKGDGLAHGVESKQIDLDWFNGGLEELREYASGSLPIDGNGEGKMKYIVLSDSLRVRSSPNLSGKILNEYSQGSTFVGTGETFAPQSGGECWVKIEKPIAGWACVTIGSTQFLRTA